MIKSLNISITVLKLKELEVYLISLKNAVDELGKMSKKKKEVKK